MLVAVSQARIVIRRLIDDYLYSGSGNSCNEQEVNSTPKVDP
ncbi:hypothetical protein HanIR_Chr17g0854661 [Helianthus annuus]|nr:hypothetical protein HanIR_Chr17g0854661 [Helianthus annuus]